MLLSQSAFADFQPMISVPDVYAPVNFDEQESTSVDVVNSTGDSQVWKNAYLASHHTQTWRTKRCEAGTDNPQGLV